MQITSRKIPDRDTWLDWRSADYVTASTVGALFDVHPYTSILRLYMAARGVEFLGQDNDNAVLRRGRWLEPSIAKAVQEQRPDWRLVAPDTYYNVPEIKLGATPDFFIEGDPRGRGVLQGKTVAPNVFANDWDDGAAVPEWIQWQAKTEMMVSDAAFAVVAALTVDPYRMVCPIIDVPATAADFTEIIERASRFRGDVEAGREPAPDFDKDADLIKKMWPRELPDNVIDLTGDNELPVLLERRASLRADIKHDEAEVDVIETELRYRMGAAEKIIGVPGWTITNKTTETKAYTVKARSGRALRINARR